MKKELKTERLILRLFELKDIERMLTIANQPEILTTLCQVPTEQSYTRLARMCKKNLKRKKGELNILLYTHNLRELLAL